MSRSLRRALAFAGAATLTLTLTACGTDSKSDNSGKTDPGQTTAEGTAGSLSGEITFQTWSLKNEKFSPYFEKLIADFEAANPGTKINWVDQPGDGYEEKILQQAGSGQLPDVVNLPPGFAYLLAEPEIDMLVDLKQADPAAIEHYLPSGIAAYEFEGLEGSFGYPWYLATDLNWWNTEAFTKAGLPTDKFPTSPEEFYATAREIAQKTDGSMPLVSAMPNLADFASAGVEIMKDGKFVFNDPKAAAIVDEYAKLFKEGAIPAEVLNSDYQGNAALFKQNKTAWTTATPGFPTQLKDDAPTLLDKIKMTPRFGISPLFVQGISVSKNSANPELALAFAQFVTNNDNQVEFVKLAQGFFPGTVEGTNNPESFTSAITDPLQAEALKLAAPYMDKAMIPEPVQWSNDMAIHMSQQISLAIKGDITGQQALDDAVKYANDNLTK